MSALFQSLLRLAEYRLVKLSGDVMKPNGHVYILAREHLRAAHQAFTVDRDPVAAAFYLERARDALRP